MLFFNNSAITVRFVKLSDLALPEQDALIKQAGIWATKNWQYIFPTIEDWEADVRKFKENFYFAIYADQPVGMFALTVLDEYKNYPRPLDVQTLFYVYVDERVRGHSVGRQILKQAKIIAESEGADMIIGATTKPSLNALYQKYGCQFICDSEFYGQTVSNLMLKLN